MNAVFAAHSGWRYLVLLAAAAALLVLLHGSFTGKPYGKRSRVAFAVFNGVLDIQLLLGIAVVALGRFYPSVIGHCMMMLLAAVAAHGASVLARKQPDHRKAHTLGLFGLLAALLLIVGGIMSIGRGVFQSTVGGAAPAPAAAEAEAGGA